MQPPTGGRAVEGFQKILAGHPPELGEYLLGRVEFDRKGMQPWLPRAGRAAAEIGRTNSGFINVVTKSGSNSVRGEAFYYDREKALTSPDV